MKTLLLILLLVSCRPEKEVQSVLMEVELIKVERVFRATGYMKWQTWKGKDEVLRVILVHADDPHVVGDKVWVMVKR